jgi:hypothetical protein
VPILRVAAKEVKLSTVRYGQHAPLSAAHVGRLAHWADRAGKQDDRPLMPFGLGLAVTAGPPYRQGLGPSSRELNCRGSFFQRPGGHRAVSRHSGVSAPSCYLLAVDLRNASLARRAETFFRPRPLSCLR